MNILKVIFRLI